MDGSEQLFHLDQCFVDIYEAARMKLVENYRKALDGTRGALNTRDEAKAGVLPEPSRIPEWLPPMLKIGVHREKLGQNSEIADAPKGVRY